jgi:hypothetical protein
MKKTFYVTAGKTFCIFKKHKTEDKKWRKDASKHGQFYAVNQLKRDDLISLKLDLRGKGNVRGKQRTAL